MAKIKHIALSTQDPEKTAAFYKEAFGLKEIRKIDSELARGLMLTDGYINIAILNFKTDEAADIEGGTKYSGLHHIGFKVDDQEEAAEVLRKVGASQRTERLDHVSRQEGQEQANVEIKWKGPDGVIFDTSETGWQGTE